MYSLTDIKNSIPEEKIKIDKMDIWVYYFVRPASFYITWILLKMKCTPTKATLLSIFVGFFGSFLILFNQTSIIITGILFINLWIVLDCVDGNIARVTKKASVFGELMDAVSGYVYVSFLYLCIGTSIYLTQSVHIFAEQKWLYIFIGALASIASILPRLIEHKAKGMFPNFKSGITSRIDYSWKYKIGLNIGGMAGLCNPLLLIFFVVGYMDMYLIFYFLFHTAVAIFSICKTLWHLNLTYNN
ncbi:CDP-alcohol phosphatidyltransferase family protein [Isobaculum melis]|uniref:Phosphatidylglycerophosphate synthase n=1 Tax=Isobaculum melis TaxID=142588 RepID=A0A1H9SLN9_9LACT|nr:CDP-alcohol phosphatidyltransferase family protein [Isobaculum melis]SER85837.1 Phosphatidylglycerophosphate synthase [Isobaculum melis]